MIIGIGIDVVDISRIRRILDRYGERFVARVFTDNEKENAKAQLDSAAFYARRFAAKEACSKALGTGFSSGISAKHIEIKKTSSGKPIIELTGNARKKLEQLVPFNEKAVIHLTITDDVPIAQAFVLIESIS